MKHFIVPVLILFFILHFLSSPCLTFQKKKQEEKPDVIIIPDKVKSFFEEGIKTREARLDIPFSIIWHTYLPSQQNLHCVFYFKVKNADLGFFPIMAEEKNLKRKRRKNHFQPKPFQAAFVLADTFFSNLTVLKTIRLKKSSEKSISLSNSRLKVNPTSPTRKKSTRPAMLFLPAIISSPWPLFL